MVLVPNKMSSVVVHLYWLKKKLRISAVAHHN